MSGPARLPEPGRYVTVADAARLCGVSDDTVRRRLASGAVPGARRSERPDGRWEIPVDGLVRAGLLREPWPRVVPAGDDADAAGMTTEITAARAELRARDEVIAALREVLAAKEELIGALRHTVRLLEDGSTTGGGR